MTDELDTGPDPLVQAALRLLPVPDHGDAFWDGLDRRLAEADGPRPAAVPAPAPSATVFALPPTATRASVVDPTPVPGPRPVGRPDSELAVIPPAMHRRSNVLLAAVAVAALLVVGLAGAALVRDDPSDGGTELADGDQSGGGQSLQTASTAVAAGVPEALSKDEVKASTTAAESYAADHAAGASTDWDQVLVTPVASGDGGTFAVVTLVGADGNEAYAVRLTDDGAEVIPTDTAGTIEMVSPEPVDDDGTEATVGGGDDLVVVLPAGALAPVLRLDDGTPVICGEADGTELAPMDGMDRVRCAWTPTALAPGAHTLTVAFTGGDGSSISADSVLFQAA